ncbi:hypothetical protein [uncultured Shimia sp.]|uniref:hypothetical protein n=1 Tax=uncultured Shimia sp. TaxID=573152 RepID=UPI00261A5BFE|nr:hypothetical protein [uncultured Shimia sp.]
MTEDEILFLDFPSDFERLCAERRINEAFQEACADFAAIKLEILKAAQHRKVGDDQFLADLNESLEDLRREIQTELVRKRDGNSH